MAANSTFDFCAARQQFVSVVQKSASEDSLQSCSSFLQTYKGSDSEKKTALDQAFRDVLRLLSEQSRGCCAYKSLISLAHEATEKDMCSTSLPFLMLADIFDVIPLEQCEDVFSLVEDRVRTWKCEPFYDAGKNYLLRMCNDLLRRLSKSQNTVFCGRIQLFLSRLFPLSEKSALNLMSQFNLENVTLYDTKTDMPKVTRGSKGESMEVEEGEMEEQTGSSPIDYNLYRRFWSLQDYFRKPSQCYEKPNWRQFAANADAVIAAFSSSKLDDMKSSRKKLDQRKQFDSDSFFAKYLTSEKLLDLQLNDSNFRRYVLVQFLIFFQYLNAPVKFKNANQSLTEDQGTWVKTTQEKVYQLIRETPPDGDTFARTVEHILSREENWNSWKNEGCPKYEKEQPKEALKVQRRAKRRRIGDDLQSSSSKVIKMGSSELTKLWNLNPNNMEACKAENRVFLPTLEDFFADAIEQNDPEAMVEEEYKLTNEQIFQWKSLRLLARRSPLFFTHTTTPALPLSQYLNYMLSKLAKELPNQSEEMKTEVGEEEEEEIKETQEEEEMKQTETEEKNKEEQDSQEKLLTKQNIEDVAAKLGKDWKKLAQELNFPEDDVSYFESESSTDTERAKKVLTIWKENEDDKATVGAVCIALKEVGLRELAQSVFGES